MINKDLQKGGDKMITQTFDKWLFEKYDKEDRFNLRVYNTNAKKQWNSLKYHFSFKSVSSRQEWIDSFIKNQQNLIDWKNKRAQERKNFNNPAKVGDILDATWGYDQTNWDYYQVIAVNGKQITVQELAQKRNETGWLQGECEPIPNKFLKDSAPLKRIVRPGYQEGYSVKIKEFIHASPWNGRKNHYTAYA